MQRPLEIAFHNLDSSPSLEAEIRQHVERLETRCGHLIGCRVSVEALHQQHRTGNPHEVHITLSLPGKEIVVSHEPHHARENRAHPDVRTCVRDAFKVAERRLDDHKGQLRADTSTPSANALSGQVVQIEPGADHGFLNNSNGSQVYFHRDSVTDGRFEDLTEGDVVHYVEERGDAGPTATKVRVGSSQKPRG